MTTIPTLGVPPGDDALRIAAAVDKAMHTVVAGGDCDDATCLNALFIAYLAVAQRAGLLHQVPAILQAAIPSVQQTLRDTTH